MLQLGKSHVTKTNSKQYCKEKLRCISFPVRGEAKTPHRSAATLGFGGPRQQGEVKERLKD